MKMHLNNCGDNNCPCQRNKPLIDPKGQDITSNFPIFKNPIVIKNLLLYELQKIQKRIYSDHDLNLAYILLLFEVLGNYPLACIEFHSIKQKLKGWSSIPYQASIYRINYIMKEKIIKINKFSNYGHNKYERIHHYDKSLELIKLAY